MTGRRTTRQRTAIAELLDDVDEFRTAQQIHDLLSARGLGIGLATVYRTLGAMVSAGELDTVQQAGCAALYRRCAGPVSHHHHLVCRECGRAVEVRGPDLEAWLRATAHSQGFTDVEHTFDLFGTCAGCAGG